MLPKALVDHSYTLQKNQRQIAEIGR